MYQFKQNHHHDYETAEFDQEMDKVLTDFHQNPYMSEICMKECSAAKQAVSPIHEIPIPSTLRVSTMTAVCNIHVHVDLRIFYENVPFREAGPQAETYPYIRTCQYASEPLRGHISEKKPKRSKAKVVKKNCFQNQATVIVVLSSERAINLKIFRNGKIQMTGLKKDEEGEMASRTLIKYLEQIYPSHPSVMKSEPQDSLTTSETSPKPYVSDMSIVLINSDFSAKFRVRREVLYEVLFKMGIYVSYEPEIYPGVNSKFYWNRTAAERDGICRCEASCNGKGDGNGDGRCKKITIATFQSGNVIITGARNTQQTHDAYEFINGVFLKYYDKIARPLAAADGDAKPKPSTSVGKGMVHRSNIVNFECYEQLKALDV